MNDRRRDLDHRDRHRSPRSARGATRSGPVCAPAARRSSGSTGSTRAPFRSQVAAQVDDFDPLAWMPPKTARQLDRFSQFGLVAGRLALDDAGLTPGATAAPHPQRIGIYLGSALGGIAYAEEQHERYLEKGHPPGRAEPRAGRLRRRGAGQPRDRPRRPRPDPVDRQLVRVGGGRARRGARRPARGPDRRGDRRRLRDPAEPARVRCVRHHPGAVGRPQRRPGARRAAVRPSVATASSWARARRCSSSRRPRSPRRAGPIPYAELLGYGATSDAHHMVQPRADGTRGRPRRDDRPRRRRRRPRRDRLRQRPRLVDADRRRRRGPGDRAGARRTGARPCRSAARRRCTAIRSGRRAPSRRPSVP